MTTPTERMIAMLQEQVATLIAERDELRREICEWCSLFTKEPPENVATRNNWDCFKEDGK